MSKKNYLRQKRKRPVNSSQGASVVLSDPMCARWAHMSQSKASSISYLASQSRTKITTNIAR